MKEKRTGQCYKCNKMFRLKRQTMHRKKVTICICNECAEKDRQLSTEKKKKKENGILSQLRNNAMK